MNWLTILLAVVIGFLTYRAYRNGFILELVSLSAIVLAIPFAGIFYDNMYPKVQPLVDNQQLASLVSFLAIMAGVIIGGQVAAHLLKNVVEALNLGVIDHTAGALFGFVKGIIICQALLIAFVTFPSPDITGAIDDSPLARQLLDGAPAVLTVLPSHFDESVHYFLDHATTLDQALGSNTTPTPTPTTTPSP
jgi:membrane protein required for colicin V production